MSSAATKRRYCYPQCADPWFNECADCWRDGGNPALYPKIGATEDGERTRPASVVVSRRAETRSESVGGTDD